MKKGFTLVEILVVVTIIVLMTSAAIVTYTVFLKQSRDAKRKADLSQLSAALEMYRSNTAPTIYIQSVPTDPKNPTYIYYYNSSTGSDYTLATHLESVATTCQSLTTQCTSNCTYCLGPYGQK